MNNDSWQKCNTAVCYTQKELGEFDLISKLLSNASDYFNIFLKSF